MFFKKNLLFFSLLFASFFCAAQQRGCIIVNGNVPENILYTSFNRAVFCNQRGYIVGEYRDNGNRITLQQRSIWSPDPRIRVGRDHCHVLRNGQSVCGGVDTTFTQLATPIDTNTSLLITVTGIIGYFAIYRRDYFA